MLYIRPIPPPVPDCSLGTSWQAVLGPRMPVLKPRHQLYHPLLVLLHKHLREGTWTGRTITVSRSLLRPCCRWWDASWESLGCSNYRGPWLQHRRVGGFAARPAHPVYANNNSLQSWQWQRQWRWATCYSFGKHLFITCYITWIPNNTCYIGYAI